MSYRGIPERVVSVASDSFISALLAFTFLFGFGRLIGIAEMSLFPFITVLVASCLVNLWLDRSRTEKVWGILFLAAAAAVLHLLVGIGKMGQFYTAYGLWLNKGIAPEGGAAKFCALQSLWVILAVSLLWRAVRNIEKIPAFVMGYGSLLPALGLLNLYKAQRAGMAFSLVLFTYGAACFVQNRWEKERNAGDMRERNRAYSLFLAPALVVLLVVLAVLPVRETPLEWKTVKTFMSRIEEAFTTWRVNFGADSENDFRMDMSGLSENVSVEGDSKASAQAFLELSCSNTPDSNLYLTGYVWQDFDGRNWAGSSTVPVKGGGLEESDYSAPQIVSDAVMAEELTKKLQAYSHARMDALETIYAVKRAGGREEDYIKYSEASVEVKYFHSDSLFLPIKLLAAENVENLAGKSKNILGYGSTYKFRYLQLNLNHPILYGLLEERLSDDEKIWDAVNYYRRGDGPIYSLQQLQEYREEIKETYSGEVLLDEGSRKWLDAVYQAAAERTDSGELTGLQKLVAIEQALSGFTYTRTPGELPGKVDSPETFLTYLLTESKTGYCTHFASAFVLLARNEGYPARLCQGFNGAAKGEKTFSIVGTDAHAWPEVYFEGFGWIPFEPTPGFYEKRYTPWAIKESTDTQSDWSGFFARMEEKKKREEAERQAALAARKEKEEADSHFAEKLADFMIKLAIGVCLVFFLGILLYYLYLRLQAKRISRMEPAERFLWTGKENLQLLAKLRMVRGDSETLAEFACRLEELGYPGAETLKGMELYRYRGDSADSAMLMAADAETEALLELFGKQQSAGFTVFRMKLLRKMIKR